MANHFEQKWTNSIVGFTLNPAFVKKGTFDWIKEELMHVHKILLAERTNVGGPIA